MPGGTCLRSAEWLLIVCWGDASAGHSQMAAVEMAESVEVDSPAACCFCDSGGRLRLNLVALAARQIRVHVGLWEAIHSCSVMYTRPLGSLIQNHNRNFDVTGWGGGLVVCFRSRCYHMSGTTRAGSRREEERSESPRLHRPGWRCADRPATARDSSRQTFCVAEANAGSQRGGEVVCRRGAERASVMPEHGVLVYAVGGCISSEWTRRVTTKCGDREVRWHGGGPEW